MKRIMVVLFLLAFALSLWAGGQAEETRMVIATAGTSGALYPMGVALAETINNNMDNVIASAESSGASLENVRNLKEGNVDWAISQNEVAFLSYNGLEAYKGKEFKELRSLFGNLIGWVQIFVPKDSEIKEIADFKGKRIGVGSPGSGGEAAAKKILSYYGLDYESIKPEFLSDSEMVNALKDGTIAGFISTHPLKSAAMLDLTTSFKARMLELKDDAFYNKYAYYTKKKIPAGTYKGVDYDVVTATSRIVMYTTNKMSEDLIYEIMKVIWEHTEWIGVHAAVKRYTNLESAAINLSAPLHKGAARYYKEMGVTIPSQWEPVD